MGQVIPTGQRVLDLSAPSDQAGDMPQTLYAEIDLSVTQPTASEAKDTLARMLRRCAIETVFETSGFAVWAPADTPPIASRIQTVLQMEFSEDPRWAIAAVFTRMQEILTRVPPGANTVHTETLQDGSFQIVSTVAASQQFRDSNILGLRLELNSDAMRQSLLAGFFDSATSHEFADWQSVDWTNL